MVAKCGISNNDWISLIDFNIITAQNNLRSLGDIRILAIILHVLKDLPILFTDANLDNLRTNITLALHYNSALL